MGLITNGVDYDDLVFNRNTPDGLSEAMNGVPALVAYWVEQVEVLDANIGQLEAKAFEREQEVMAAGTGKPPAIERVRMRVDLDPSVHAARLARAHAKAMAEGLKAKASMLISSAALMREEMRGDLRVNE